MTKQKQNKYKIYARYIKFAVALKKEKQLICEMCKEKKVKSSDLVCHHIVPIKKIYNFEMIMDASNILVLCHSCHAHLHRTRLGNTGNVGQKKIGGKYNIGGMAILRNIERRFNK